MNDLMIDLRETFQAWLQQQVVNLDSYTPEPSRCRKIPICYDDDDDEEKEPKDSFIMGDEHLDTIPEKKSDEFIKSSVENLVPSPSEFEDISDGECDLPLCNDLTTVSNPLFDAENNFSSSDDKSSSDEDIDPHHFNAKSDLIESLLNQDTLIVSSPNFDSLLEEFSGELAHIDLIFSEINETDFDHEEEIRYVERLFNYSLSLPDNESFHFDIPSSPRPLAKPPDDGIYFEPDTGVLIVKVDCPDFEDSSHGFVLRSLDLNILSFI
nr:hypothetical protein [Tanacetum cinerariifolium]